MIANDFKYHRDILDTMVDVDIKDKEEFIKELMKLFIIVFYVILHSFLPRNQLIIILCTHDMLDTMVEVEDKEEFIK